MQVPLKYKKVGEIVYYVPILLENTPESLNLVSQLINMHRLTIGKNIQDLLDDNELINKFNDIRVYHGLITVLSKYFFRYETNIPDPSVSPESVRIKLYAYILESGKSFFLPEEKDNVYKELKKHSILSMEQIEQTLFADHAIYRIVKLNEDMVHDLSPETVIQYYNTELLYTLFKKSFFLEFSLPLDSLRGSFVKEFVYLTKRLGIFVDFQRIENTILIKALGPQELVGRPTKYGQQLCVLFLHFLNYFSTQQIQIRLEITYFEHKRIILLESARLPPLKSSITNEKNILEENKFDSKIEEKFHEMFQVLSKGWTIEREPVIIEKNIIMLPDFELCYQNKIRIFLEIVGFWTERYLSHKTRKIKLLEDKYPNMILWIDEKLNFPEVKLKVFKYGKNIPSLEFINYLKNNYQLPLINKQVAQLLEKKRSLLTKIEAECLQKKYLYVEQLIQDFPELGDEEQFKVLIDRGFMSNIQPLPTIVYAKNSMILFSLPILLNVYEKLQENRKIKILWEADELQKTFQDYGLPSKELRLCWKLVGCKWTMKNLLSEQITLPAKLSLNTTAERIITL